VRNVDFSDNRSGFSSPGTFTTTAGSSAVAVVAGGTIAGSVTTDAVQISTIRTQAAAALPTASFDTTLDASLAAGVGYVISGEGGDYRLNVGASSVVAKHKDADNTVVTPGPGYVTDIRTGLIITANGIAMGYNKKSDGVWVNAVAISSTGNATLKGSLSVADLTAGTINADIATAKAVVLDTNGKIYTAGKISATDPTAGVFLGHDGGSSYDFAVGDSTKSIVYDGSDGSFTITNIDIITSGQVLSTGQTSISGQPPASVIGNIGTIPGGGGSGVLGRAVSNSGSSADAIGVSGIAVWDGGLGTIYGVLGYADNINGVGVEGWSPSGIGVSAVGSVALSAVGPCSFSGGDITIADNIKMTGATKNLVIGNATITGNSNLIIKEGVAGSRLDNQMIMYGALSTDADTTLGIITEQDVVAGTGAFAGILQIRIVWNGAEYWLPLQAV
jgi:hypothetical protein